MTILHSVVRFAFSCFVKRLGVVFGVEVLQVFTVVISSMNNVSDFNWICEVQVCVFIEIVFPVIL